MAGRRLIGSGGRGVVHVDRSIVTGDGVCVCCGDGDDTPPPVRYCSSKLEADRNFFDDFNEGALADRVPPWRGPIVGPAPAWWSIQNGDLSQIGYLIALEESDPPPCHRRCTFDVGVARAVEFSADALPWGEYVQSTSGWPSFDVRKELILYGTAIDIGSAPIYARAAFHFKRTIDPVTLSYSVSFSLGGESSVTLPRPNETQRLTLALSLIAVDETFGVVNIGLEGRVDGVAVANAESLFSINEFCQFEAGLAATRSDNFLDLLSQWNRGQLRATWDNYEMITTLI